MMAQGEPAPLHPRPTTCFKCTAVREGRLLRFRCVVCVGCLVQLRATLRNSHLLLAMADDALTLRTEVRRSAACFVVHDSETQTVE